MEDLKINENAIYILKVAEETQKGVQQRFVASYSNVFTKKRLFSMKKRSNCVHHFFIIAY